MKPKLLLFSAVTAGAIAFSVLSRRSAGSGCTAARSLALTATRTLGKQVCQRAILKCAATVGTVALITVGTKAICQACEPT